MKKARTATTTMRLSTGPEVDRIAALAPEAPAEITASQPATLLFMHEVYHL